MNTAPDDTPSAPQSLLHRRALTLAAILLALFVVATGLYGRYGYRFVLRVYATQQLGRAVSAKDSAKFVEYEDYLRVDPANLYMRGLLINQMIELHEPARALETAKAGIEAVAAGQRPIAMLLIARAQIANGQFEEAERTYTGILSEIGESGEAHCGLADIAAARGDFESMRRHRALLAKAPTRGCTPDFFEVVRVPEPVKPGGSWESLLELGLERHARGSDLDYGVSATFGNDVNQKATPPILFFVNGVYEERKGHRDAALLSYDRAAKDGNALGKFAYARLSGAAQQNAPSGPK